MGGGNIQIPEWVDGVLGPALWILFGLTLVWMALSLVRRMHQRAYNLTSAETSGAPIRPDFLSVDRARRDRAISAGGKFDAAPAADAPSSGAVSTVSKLAKVAAFVVALVSFLTAAGGALMQIQPLQNMYEKLVAWERFVAIIEKYKIGFAMAAVIIVFNLILFIAKITGKQKA